MGIQATIWRGMAQEARDVAGRLYDLGLREELLAIAGAYDRMADRFEALADSRTANDNRT